MIRMMMIKINSAGVEKRKESRKGFTITAPTNQPTNRTD
jgi:hypothetical protein